MAKVLERSGIQGTCLNLTKTNYSKTIANINLMENEEKLKTIQQEQNSPKVFKIVLKVLAIANKTTEGD